MVARNLNGTVRKRGGQEGTAVVEEGVKTAIPLETKGDISRTLFEVE
jgi:hypothetical protein